MANGPRTPPSSVLESRVVTLERDVGHIEHQVDAIRETMATRGDIEKISASLGALAAQASTVGKTNWQALTVLLSGIGIIGTLVYLPINNAITDLKTSIHEVAGTTIQQQRYNADKTRLDADISNFHNIIGQRVSRDEWGQARDGLANKVDILAASFKVQMEDLIRRIERLESNQMAGQPPKQ